MNSYIKKQNSFAIITIAVVTILLLGWMLLSPNDSHHNEQGHDDHEEEEVAKGPHGGRLLDQHNTDDDFSLEITIYETGLPPEFRVYAYHNDQPVAPDQVTLDIELKRLSTKSSNRRMIIYAAMLLFMSLIPLK
jgi:cobalt-zinc-cadmium efflux system membrane fusion protein